MGVRDEIPTEGLGITATVGSSMDEPDVPATTGMRVFSQEMTNHES